MLKNTIEQFWLEEAQPTLMDFIRLPSKSTAFDPQWKEHGYLLQACRLAANWIQKIIPDATCEIIEDEGKTPCLFVEIGSNDLERQEKTIAFYGHLDKQPENEGWKDGLGPWTPYFDGEYLFGRGACDDGYSVFAMITAVETLRRSKMKHPRIVAIFETQEESGSSDLEGYLHQLKAKIGSPECFIVLDNQCGDYNRLWLNTSLRGNISGTLSVSTMSYGVHSGSFSGIVPDPFTVAMTLLGRIQHPETGEILLDTLQAQIPALRLKQIQEVSLRMGDQIWKTAPLLENVQPKYGNNDAILIQSTWKPSLTIIGIDGIPSIQNAGNVIQGSVSLRLSFRIPPGIDIDNALQSINDCFTQNIPYGCSVTWNSLEYLPGWCAPSHSVKYEKLFHDAGEQVFEEKTLACGQGASIGFIPKFEKLFPKTEIILIGVLGPQSNAHSPNEALNVLYTQKLIETIAIVLSKE